MKSRIFGVLALLIAAMVAADAQAQGTGQPGSGASTCKFAWFLEMNADHPEANWENRPALAFPDAMFAAITGYEGPMTASTPVHFANAGMQWYRFENCEEAKPFVRAECYSWWGPTLLPALEKRGEVLFDVWLTDDNPGCIASSRFRAITNPKTAMTIREHVDSNCNVQTSIQGKLQEEFSLTVPANNGVDVDVNYNVNGGVTSVSFSIGGQAVYQPWQNPPLGGTGTVGAGISWTPQQVTQVLPVNKTFEAGPKDSKWCQGTANAMSLYGRVQHQAQAAAGGLGYCWIFGSLFGSDHRTTEWWSATPAYATGSGQGGVTGGGSGGTTGGGSSGGTTGGGGGGTTGGGSEPGGTTTKPTTRPTGSPLRPDGPNPYGGPYDNGNPYHPGPRPPVTSGGTTGSGSFTPGTDSRPKPKTD